MLRYPIFFIPLVCLGILTSNNQVTAQTHSDKFQFKREKLPPIPANQIPEGVIFGELDGTIILAGGIQDSEEPEINADITLLPSGSESWVEADTRLPVPLAHSGFAHHNETLLVVGGLTDEETPTTQVFSLALEGKQITVNSLPQLPDPLWFPQAAVLNNTLYVLGTPVDQTASSNPPPMQLWSLPLASGPDIRQAWTQHPPFPGTTRIMAVMAGQDDHLFVLGGAALTREFTPDNFTLESALPTPSLRDAWRFTPGRGNKPGTWTQRADLPAPIAIRGGTTMLMGQTHMALPLQRPEAELKNAHTTTRPYSFAVYHSITDSWVFSTSPLSERYGLIPQVPISGASESLLILIQDSDILRPFKLTPSIHQQTLTNFDWIVIFIYLTGVLGMGFYIARIREDTTFGFFQASRKMPFWAVGLSLLATNVSSISFMAIPAVAYATDWVRILNSLTVILIIPFVVHFFLPFFRRLDVSTAYEYLNKRFNLGVRLFGSVTFILSQLARIGIVIYLPSIALSAATGVDTMLCVLVMGVFTTIYTFFGGMTAVVWTDVVQGTVLIGGAILCIFHIAGLLGGFPDIIEISMKADKFHTFDWRLDPTELVVWVVVTGSFFKVLGVYVSDQSMVQRYLTTKNETEAAKGLWTNLIVITPLAFVFYGLGSCLFAFYNTFPEQLSPGKTDQILPFFIVQQLPIGISGILIAAIFAASMSSLDSSINSISSVCVNDFYKRLFRNSRETLAYKMARIITIITGLLGTLVAVGLLKLDIKYIQDQGLIFLGLIGGGLTGLFVLGIFSIRTHAGGALPGALIGSMIPLVIARFTDFNFFLFGAIGVVSTIILGYILSLAIPAKQKNLENLTWWTMHLKKDIPPKKDAVEMEQTPAQHNP